MEARFDGFPLTYIPLRNAIFYSFAASYAEEAGARYLVGGHNRGDPRTFRDAGGAFLGNMERALRSGSAALDEGGLRILRPLERMTKPQVVRLAARVGVPFQLTWSCHSEGPRHCWRCGGCRTRVEAFRKAGVADPLRTRIPRKVS